MESPLDPIRNAADENFESFRQLFDQSPLGVAFVDLNYWFMKVNPALCRMFGYTADEILRLNGADLVYPDDLESVLENVGRLASGEIDHYQIERRYVRKDGQAVLGRLTVCGIRNSGGQLSGFLAMVEDIAEQRRAEEELRNREMLLRTLADNVREVFWIYDLHQRQLLYVNRALEAVAGGGLDDILSAPDGWLRLLVPEDQPRALACYGEAIAGRPFQLELRVLGPDDTIRWLWVKGFPLPEPSGEVRRTVGTCEDMTERHVAEERVRQHEAELAHVSRLSTMGELAAGLAHELHQPLHAINNYACGSMLRMDQRGRQDDELRSALSRISTEATRAAEIIRRLHAFVRKRQPRRQSFSLLAVLDDAVFLVADEARRRKCRVAVERPAALPEIVGDAIQIEQVLLNLIRNAFDAMEATPQDRRIVHIGVRLSDEGPIVVEVRDHGCGIAPDDLIRIFEPFYTTKAEGLGMGLSISRSILHAHNGDLRAAAHTEGGTSFFLTLPVGKLA